MVTHVQQEQAQPASLFEKSLKRMSEKGHEFAYVSELAEDARLNTPSWRARE